MYTLGLKTGKYDEPVKVANVMVQRLRRYGPFIYHISRDRRSVYIHFRKLPNDLEHKLRVSDHDERERYGYKWQLRLDVTDLSTIHEKRWARYFNKPDPLVEAFKRYYDKVERCGPQQTRREIDWDFVNKRGFVKPWRGGTR